MEVHSSSAHSVVPKRLWNFFRIAYFMMRKGLISKRKLLMDMNMMMKRGKILRKTLGNLMFHHHSRNMVTRGAGPAGSSFGLQEYEFSCSNSPNPVFSYASKRKHNFFPCINPPDDDLDEEVEDNSRAVVVVPNNKVAYSPGYSCNFQFGTPDLAPGEKLSPLVCPFTPISIRISDYLSEDENEGDHVNKHVDDDAEEFIRKFYEQLKVQRRTQLLQYQEIQYEQMLARGTR